MQKKHCNGLMMVIVDHVAALEKQPEVTTDYHMEMLRALEMSRLQFMREANPPPERWSIIRKMI